MLGEFANKGEPWFQLCHKYSDSLGSLWSSFSGPTRTTSYRQLASMKRHLGEWRSCEATCWRLRGKNPNDVRTTSLSQFYTLRILSRCLNPPSHHMFLLRKAPEAPKSVYSSKIAPWEVLSHLGLGASVLWASGGSSLSAYFSERHNAFPTCGCAQCFLINGTPADNKFYLVVVLDISQC